MAQEASRTLGVRQPRDAAPERRERRRRDTGTETQGLKLPIPDWVRDKYPEKNFVYYWAVGSEQRLHELHKADWDRAEGGDGNSLPGAADRHGNSVDHILMVKYRDWYDEDRGQREIIRSEREDQMKRGNVTGQGDDAGGSSLSTDVSYADASNRLR